ncbi:hypothetical protein GOV14_02080 [Candidatus Pacearchaeota archaeon]|nr:hypothetical protein [Candidatus Pacearchaeota archaeon]
MKYKKAEGQVFNCGSGREYSIEQLAHIIADRMGRNSIKIEVEKGRLRPLDVERLLCNYSKLHKLTGWKPSVNIEDGLKSTIDCFNEQGSKWIWETKIASEDKVWAPDTSDNQ